MTLPKTKKAVFLDRDNTLIDDGGYSHDASAVKFVAGAFDALLALQRAGFLLFVVTNQSGIGRGYFPEADAIAVHSRITDMLRERGVRIEKIYYCPHAPEEGCECRKPKPFLVLKAAEEFGIDLAKSFFVGDHIKDAETGRAAGIMTVLIGHAEASPMADISVRNIAEATEKIISYEKLHG